MPTGLIAKRYELRKMEGYYLTENIIAVVLIVFGFTSLKIFKYVREHDFDTVDSVIDKKYWWYSGNRLRLGSFFNVYKIYHKNKGLNLVFILNIASYFVFLVLLLKLTSF